MRLGRICERGCCSCSLSILGFDSSQKATCFSRRRVTGDDLILCQITSRLVLDRYAIPLETDDFSSGNLRQSSNIRPNRLFTADRQIILSKVGQVKSEKLDEVIAKIVEILQQ